jgi:hypothetical protein
MTTPTQPRPDSSRPEPPHPQPPATPQSAAPPPGWGEPTRRTSGWSPLRIVGVVLGSVLVLQSLALLVGGAGTLWVDRVLRDDAGYLTSQTESLSTEGYALTTENIAVQTAGVDLPDLVMGEVRVRVSGSDGAPLFVGVAPTGEVAEYLGDVQTTTVLDLEAGDYRQTDGGAPAGPPAGQDIWAVQSSGAGTQTLEWQIEDGDWTVVVMNADATAEIDARADIGATVPFLGWLAVGLLVAGGLLLLVGVVLIVVSIPRGGQTRTS